MTRTLHLLGLLVAITTSKLPVALLQIGVWASMFEDFYEKTQSVIASTQWTFDGDHRCQGCELVSDITTGGQKDLLLQESLTKEVKLSCAQVENLVFSPSSFSKCIISGSQWNGIFYDGVELPPPRIRA